MFYCRQNHILSQQGATLLEVIIALFILSLGLLGIIQVQDLSLRQTQESHLNTIAITQAENLFEQLRMTKILLYSNEFYVLLKTWNTINQQLLPNGEGECVLENNQLIVYLFWQDVTMSNQTPCAWFPEEKRTCLRWVGAYDK